MSYTILFNLLFLSCKSVPCVPANTCFQVRTGNALSSLDISLGRSVALADSSTKFTCSNGIVTQQLYLGVNDCSGAPNSELAVTTLTTGDSQSITASSGLINVDFLQGENCPTLTDKSEECQAFMILKHRGNKYWINADSDNEEYGDIGDNCTNEATVTIYDTVFAPVGCVPNTLGSKLFSCDANGWSFMQYSNSDCTGTTSEQYSDAYVTDKCGYYALWSDTSGQPCDGPNDGPGCLLWDHHYWYDLDCCPINGKTCCGAPIAGPSAYTDCINTPYPTTTPITTLPTTKTPTTNSPTTDSPTTKQPTDSSGTVKPSASPTTKPSKAPTTKAPTTPGTAEPTAPTTGAPTDENGTARPTSPTTKAPTTPGTARPTDENGTARPISSPETTVDNDRGGKEGNGNGDLAWWWWIIIIVLIIIFCFCLVCCFYFLLYKKKKDTSQYFGNQDDTL